MFRYLCVVVLVGGEFKEIGEKLSLSEINPAEHIWDALREDCIGNTAFASLEAADKALCKGLKSLEMGHTKTQTLTGFKWITSISLNAK